MSTLIERLRQYNPPDRTIDSQRQISVDIHEAADTIDLLTRELANARASGVHSCHPDCTRSGCVNQRLRAEVAGMKRYRLEEAEKYEKLMAERDALREDAERYRFLRDVSWHEGALLPFIERYGPFEWDDAIDEAMGEK